MCNYKGLRLKGFAEQKSATHLTLQYIIINLVKNFLYVCTEYVSIMKCYINWCNSPMMGDKNTKNMKYILNCQLLSISIIHVPTGLVAIHANAMNVMEHAIPWWQISLIFCEWLLFDSGQPYSSHRWNS